MNSSLAKVMAAGIRQTLEKVNEGFISMIAEKYDIDPTELEEMLATVVKEVAKTEQKQMKKSKKMKTPRKTSAYNVFVTEKYSEVQAANEGEEFGKISKLIGKMWRSLDEEEKAEYEAKARIVNEKEKTNKNEKKTKQKKNKKTKKQKKTSSDEESSSEIDEENKKKTCVALLQSGKREGQECGAKAAEDSGFCKRHNKPKAKKPKKNEKKTKAKKNEKKAEDEMKIPENDEILSEDEDDNSYEDEINELEIAEESDNESDSESDNESDSEKHVHFSDEDEVHIMEEDPTVEYVGTGIMRRAKPRDSTVRHTGKNRSVDRFRKDRWD